MDGCTLRGKTLFPDVTLATVSSWAQAILVWNIRWLQCQSSAEFSMWEYLKKRKKWRVLKWSVYSAAAVILYKSNPCTWICLMMTECYFFWSGLFKSRWNNDHVSRPIHYWRLKSRHANHKIKINYIKKPSAYYYFERVEWHTCHFQIIFPLNVAQINVMYIPFFSFNRAIVILLPLFGAGGFKPPFLRSIWWSLFKLLKN